MKDMKIAHYQLESHPGDYEKNISKVISGLEQADAEGIDIISFPEAFLTGYFSSGEKACTHSFTINGPEIREFLARAAGFRATFMVGFNEMRGDKLFNTVLVAETGECLGTYSKAFPSFDYFTPGREFPVFKKDEITFGVVICADGGYIEPTRILALKGARIIFAPHYNYLRKEELINHFRSVRADHIARARENGVWFLRGNNVNKGYDAGMGYDGVGYGESYLLDPMGELVVRGERHVECMITARVNIGGSYSNRTRFFDAAAGRSAKSLRALGSALMGTLDDVQEDP